MGKHEQDRRQEQRHWRRTLGAASATLALVAAVDAVAAQSSTTSEGIVSIAPHAVATTTILAGKSVSYAVSGGTTTVPTDATRVELAVTVSNQ